MNATFDSLGIYTLAEAAHLVRVPTRSINQWLYGYDYTRKFADETVKKHVAPIWTPQYDSNTWGEKVIGFRDLLELRVVREFIQHGVSVAVIRKCFENAKSTFNDSYPLTALRFATDGKTIFADAVRSETVEEMMDLHKKQYVFRQIIKPSLYEGIEYDEKNAKRWFPEGKKRDIVIDPDRQFGKPIVAEFGVPTAALFASYKAEGADKAAVAMVARIFEIPTKSVSAAIRFEEHLLQAA
ncbi:MAG TPA: DUF433 domain-containing protein [Burkholderiaceae bacterium]|nr:DUF433 domain-containing protein [Burkholderiaceae bacterium]